MSDPVWYRSLYWRIAIGFVAMLAVLLLVQGLLVLYLTDRLFAAARSRTPAQIAETVAADVGAELERNPSLDVQQFVESRYSDIYQPFIVRLLDGRMAANRRRGLPANFENMSLGLLRDPPRPPPWARGRRGGPLRPETAPVLVAGQQTGVVAVPSAPPPFGVALAELGGPLVLAGLTLLAIGATATALIVFRPAHKRLRSLEQAARALGEGRTDVRANESGGDEVSALARTFNRMAGDLETRAAALAESDRARRQLLADVSHELMTPLSAIRGYVETLAMPELSLDGGQRRRYLEIVEQETHRLERIIGDLLDLARLEGGGETLTIEAVPVEDLFQRVRDRHEPVLRERRIALDVRIEPDTPRIAGDAARLEQALQNVAANAIRHTPDGSRVTLSAGPSADRVRLVVRDAGGGIPAEHLAHIFDRFYKVDASRTGTNIPSGSGLGLSIVRAIVERHGGAITAANAQEGGAEFEIVLPGAGASPVPATLAHIGDT